MRAWLVTLLWSVNGQQCHCQAALTKLMETAASLHTVCVVNRTVEAPNALALVVSGASVCYDT